MSQPDDPGQQGERGAPRSNPEPTNAEQPNSDPTASDQGWQRPGQGWQATDQPRPDQPRPDQQWQAPGPEQQQPPQQPYQPQQPYLPPQQYQPPQQAQQQPYQSPQGPGPQPGQQDFGPYAGSPYPPAQLPPMSYPPSVMQRSDYASWGKRVGAYLLDYIPGYVVSIVVLIWYVGFIGSMITAMQQGDSYVPDLTSLSVWMIVICVLSLISLGWTIYNRWITGGRTGQSLGKRVTKIKLISEQTGQPIGAGYAFLRDIVHYLDGIAYVGYLWPLWDEKRQTFADKLMQTIVIDQPDRQS